jgi:hypothetical protein
MQMTTTDVLAAKAGGYYAPYLHLFVDDDHLIDQQLHQPALLLVGTTAETDPDSLAEIFDDAARPASSMC